MPRVSVVVPARNEEAYIDRCLEALLQQKPPPDEVIVVDNGSKDRTAAIAEAWGARVVLEPKPGVHHARQAGLKAARYEIVAQTDADTRVLPGWIAAIHQGFADPATVATYGPIEFDEDAPVLDRWLSRRIFPLFLRLSAVLGQPNVSGANHAVRRETALAVGGYDRPFAEDVHLAQKLSSLGRIRYLPHQRVATSGRRLARGRWKMYGVHAKNVLARLLGRPEDYGPDYFADRER